MINQINGDNDEYINQEIDDYDCNNDLIFNDQDNQDEEIDILEFDESENDIEFEEQDDDNEYLQEHEILDFISSHSNGTSDSSTMLTGEEIYKMELQIPNLIKEINSNNIDEVLKASIEIRKLLQIDNSPFLSKIINSGGLPTFIKLLSCDSYPEIQFECCWILTNLAASTSEHTSILIANDVIKPLVKLLGSMDESIRQQACWTLGNICCDSDEYRNLILMENNSFELILNIINDLSNVKLETVQTITWTISNILRSIRKAPPMEFFEKSLPYLFKLLDYPDEEVLKDTCWSLVYGISQENTVILNRIQTAIDCGNTLLCSKIIKLLYHSNIDIQTPAIRFISFVSSGTNLQINHLLKTKILIKLNGYQIDSYQHPSDSQDDGTTIDNHNLTDGDQGKSLISSFYNLLQTPRISILNDVIWSLSQLISCDKLQISQLIDNALVPILINLLNNADPPIQLDIFLILSNSIMNTTDLKQLQYLISQGCLKSMLNFFTYSQPLINNNNNNNNYNNNDVDDSSSSSSLSHEKLIRILLLCIENILNCFILKQNQYKTNNIDTQLSSSPSPHPPYQQCIKNIKDANGILFLSKLQNHSNKFIKDKTNNILKSFNKFIIISKK